MSHLSWIMGIAPETENWVHEMIAEALDKKDAAMRERDAEIEQLKALLSHWYEMWNDGIPNPDDDVLLDTQAALTPEHKS